MSDDSHDTDPRGEALRQIRRLRGQIDPQVLRKAELAQKGMVPYDTENAQEAVDIFLNGHADKAAYLQRLKRAMDVENN